MSGSAALLRAIKSALRLRGLTYRDLAKLLDVSEPTVKRDLTKGRFSLKRLDEICTALGLTLADLLQPPEDQELVTQLSEAQELALVSQPRYFVVTYLLVNDWKLTARNFAWRKDGPVHSFFVTRFVPEFFHSAFDGVGDAFRFVGGTLSPGSLSRFKASLERLAIEFEEFARGDARLPLTERDGCSAILAVRAWEFSEFTRLRRVGIQKRRT